MSLNLYNLEAEKDLEWSWQGRPFFRIKSGDRKRLEEVLPAPAYEHDLALTEEYLKLSAEKFPIDRDVNLYVLDRDTPEGTNGCTHINHKYDNVEKDKNEEYPWEPTIVLYGKKIPPHPAMTRYLVAHEYGHVVRKYISWMRGEREDQNTLYDEYGKLREMEGSRYYGPGMWHKSIQELFANDFRILVAGVETEYWPHAGFERPELLLAVRLWWEHIRELAHKEKVVEAT